MARSGQSDRRCTDAAQQNLVGCSLGGPAQHKLLLAALTAHRVLLGDVGQLDAQAQQLGVQLHSLCKRQQEGRGGSNRGCLHRGCRNWHEDSQLGGAAAWRSQLDKAESCWCTSPGRSVCPPALAGAFLQVVQ